MVFLGLDDEENPSCGGIYEAELDVDSFTSPTLTPLANIGGPVLGKTDETFFARIGEVFSYDGNAISFWGAWEMGDYKTIKLCCPATGNKDRRDFYLRRGNYTDDPVTDEVNGDANSICTNVPEECKIEKLAHDGCYQEKDVSNTTGLGYHSSEYDYIIYLTIIFKLNRSLSTKVFLYIISNRNKMARRNTLK